MWPRRQVWAAPDTAALCSLAEETASLVSLENGTGLGCGYRLSKVVSLFPYVVPLRFTVSPVPLA
jgi:hypothetical protein